MTKEKVLQAIAAVEARINKHFVDYRYADRNPARIGPYAIKPTRPVALKHILWMTDECRKFVQEDRVEKAHRWLGFMQGVLWSYGLCDLDQLKDMNKPYEEPIQKPDLESST